MKIESNMIEWANVPKFFRDWYFLQQVEYPTLESKRRYVLQAHWRGASVHLDLRLEMNDHLTGYTWLNPLGPGTPNVSTLDEAKTQDQKIKIEINKGFRFVPKAKQPKDWLDVEGVIPPGGVGATVENEGVLHIIDKGVFVPGAQKAYYKEYFFKSDSGNFFSKEYTRFILRVLRLPVQAPETKKPQKQKELIYRGFIPSTQEPYMIDSRAIKEGWKAPKIQLEETPTDFKDWMKKNFADDYIEWEKYMNLNSLNQRRLKRDKKCPDCDGELEEI